MAGETAVSATAPKRWHVGTLGRVAYHLFGAAGQGHLEPPSVDRETARPTSLAEVCRMLASRSPDGSSTSCRIHHDSETAT